MISWLLWCKRKAVERYKRSQWVGENGQKQWYTIVEATWLKPLNKCLPEKMSATQHVFEHLWTFWTNDDKVSHKGLTMAMLASQKLRSTEQQADSEECCRDIGNCGTLHCAKVCNSGALDPVSAACAIPFCPMLAAISLSSSPQRPARHGTPWYSMISILETVKKWKNALLLLH